MNFTLHVWRQKNAQDQGRLVTYQARNVTGDVSLLEMLDAVNEELVAKGEDLITFSSDCREGICGACSLVINGIPHGPKRATTVCQLYMRHFQDGQEITIEPWRAEPFPVIRDLVVDRSAFDRIMRAGGYISVNAGSAPEANTIAIAKEEADTAFEAAACIGCGACVAACKNASAMLFVASKVAHFAHLPQGQVERTSRVISLVDAMDREGFGNCTNYYECEAVCPEEIPVRFIAEMNRDFLKAALTSREYAHVPQEAEHEE